MSESQPSPEALAKEIIASNEDISPMVSEVAKQIRLLRECGLPDKKIRQTVPGMYRLKEEAAETGALKEPKPDEIRVLSLPAKYQRDDWT